MIGIVVGLIIIIFAIIIFINFFSYTSTFLNIIILITLYFLISKDLKDKDNHKYYLFSLLLTAIFFIFSNTQLGIYILYQSGKLLISMATVPVILFYLFSHIIALVYEYSDYLYSNYVKTGIKNRQNI